MPLYNYQALYSIIGTKFGGDGKTTFNLPDLRGHAVAGVGQQPGGVARQWGQTYGDLAVTITSGTQLGVHTHSLERKAQASTQNVFSLKLSSPTATAGLGVVALSGGALPQATANVPDTTLSPAAIGYACGSTSTPPTAHNNLQPYLILNFCICVTNGVYPMRP